MAIKILSTNHEKMVDGVNYVRAEIAVDSADDLTVTGVQNFHFTMGSIAWVIGTGDVYGLNSSGTWEKQ